MKIRILCNDKIFYGLLELELCEMGFEVIGEGEGLNDARIPVLCDLDGYSEEQLSSLCRGGEIYGFTKGDASSLSAARLCLCVFERPFLMSELRAALERYITGDRREQRVKRESPKRVSEFGRRKNMLTCNTERCEAMFGAHTISLTPAETAVLSLLCDNRGETVSREALSALFEGAEGNISDVYICKLRAKLDNTLGIKFIYTVKGVGYMLK